MVVALVGAIATLIAGLLAFAPGYFLHKQQSRQRDGELLSWGREVIRMMADLETHCAPVRPDAGPVDTCRVETLATLASVLIDGGRLFFTDVAGERIGEIERPLRSPHPQMLDEVLKAFYIARHLAETGQRSTALRARSWSTRARFVACLQAEMGQSMRRPAVQAQLDHVPPNPLTWNDGDG